MPGCISKHHDGLVDDVNESLLETWQAYLPLIMHLSAYSSALFISAIYQRRDACCMPVLAAHFFMHKNKGCCALHGLQADPQSCQLVPLLQIL
jgi:hypothetical protein